MERKVCVCLISLLVIWSNTVNADIGVYNTTSEMKQQNGSTVLANQSSSSTESNTPTPAPPETGQGGSGTQTNTTTADNSNGTATVEPTSGDGQFSQESTPEPENGNKTAVNNETSTAEPEDGTAEPEKGEPEPEGEAEPESSFAEPAPEWDEAKAVWKEAWEFHVYFFGSLFAVLGLYCILCVIRLWKMNHLLSRHYFLSLHVLNIIVCALRAVYLFVDAYNSRGSLSAILDYFLYSTVFPCLTALFSLLFYALLLATRFRMMSQKIQKLRVLVAIIAVHFILSIVTDIVVGLSSGAAVLIFICQLFYVIWGLIMFIGYVVIFKRLYHGAINRQEAIDKKVQKKYLSVQGVPDKVPKHKHSLGLAVKITLASAIFGVLCICFQLFGIFGVYGVIGHYRTPEPWNWWAYHSGLRLLELLMCFCIAIVSSQPLKYTAKDQKHQNLMCLIPCCVLCRSDKQDKQFDVSNSFGLEPSIASETKKWKT